MLQNRPPIVVILGHVDHGKTTLLDSLRKSNVATREAGGITQAISSFQVANITFIDTPGHAAFSAMRQRGSQLADIAILVVSAVDGVMPQTKESLDFITTVRIPYIIAINKIDVTGSDPDRIKGQLAGLGSTADTVNISAKTGTGLPQLLELINLLAELNPPKADPDGALQALVLESRLDSKRGPLAVVIVKNGTLHVGDILPLGKVKALTDSTGISIKEALPSTPVEILGLTQVPAIGSEITSILRPSPPAKLLQLRRGNEGEVALKLILRTDNAGSLEAITAALPSTVQLILADTGEVTQSDILLAKTTGAKIIAFNVKVSGSVASLSATEKIPVRSYKIIYELLGDLDKLLAPAPADIVTGTATVLAQFKINADLVAGCKCISGQFLKSDQVKLVRGNAEVGRTRIKSLRIGKTETDLIKTGTEFGVILRPPVAFQTGDSIMACSTENHG